jgi:hypothetical protein
MFLSVIYLLLLWPCRKCGGVCVCICVKIQRRQIVWPLVYCLYYFNKLMGLDERNVHRTSAIFVIYDHQILVWHLTFNYFIECVGGKNYQYLLFTYIVQCSTGVRACAYSPTVLFACRRITLLHPILTFIFIYARFFCKNSILKQLQQM